MLTDSCWTEAAIPDAEVEAWPEFAGGKGRFLQFIGCYAHLGGGQRNALDQGTHVFRHAIEGAADDMNLVPAVRLGAVDDGAQIAAGEALDILHHLLQRAQAGTDQDVHHRCQQQGRDHTGQEQHVAHGDAFLEALVEPAAGGHRPSPGRRRGGHDDLFPRRAGRIDKGIAEDAVLLGQHLAQHRLGLLGNVGFTDLLVLELRVHDEFADPLFVGRTQVVGVAGLARDKPAELLANALEFVSREMRTE